MEPQGPSYLERQLATWLSRFLVDLGVTLAISVLALVSVRILESISESVQNHGLEVVFLTTQGRQYTVAQGIRLFIPLWFSASLIANMTTTLLGIIRDRRHPQPNHAR